MSGNATPDPGSFRDPSGFVYARDGQLRRQVNRQFAETWDAVVASGLYDELIGAQLLVAHTELSIENAADALSAYVVIEPERIPFISYAYEWSFSQLQDAALLTLEIEGRARARGMTLRDASAHNIQFAAGKPIFIDSLSFEPASGGSWRPYRQFCEHFLAPLALMAHGDPRLGLLQRDHVDGIPLDLASRMLPIRTRLSPALATHIHLHARAQRKTPPDARDRISTPRVSETGRKALLDHLRRTVDGLHVTAGGTTWSDYAGDNSYSEAAATSKARLVERALREVGGQWAWDLGANTGVYSQLAVDLGYQVIAMDGDWAAVERAYRDVRRRGERRLLPIVQDLSNPSPSLGWGLRERASLVERSNSDVVLALALIHHLVISGGIPLALVSSFFASLAPALIIEFVPKEDPMVQRLLAARKDIFDDYTVKGFRNAFARNWVIASDLPIDASSRRLFHMIRR